MYRLCNADRVEVAHRADAERQVVPFLRVTAQRRGFGTRLLIDSSRLAHMLGAAGIVLRQQSGRRRFQLVVLPFCRSHMVTLPERKNRAFSVAAYVPQPPPGSWSFSGLPSASDKAPGRT